MSELDPLLANAYSAARAERPRSGKGKAQTIAALGLSSATAAAHASTRAAAGPAAGGLLARWPWWALGVALLAATGAVFRTGVEPAPSSAAVGEPAAAVESSSTDTAAPVLTVDQLPNAAAPALAASDARGADPVKAADPVKVAAPAGRGPARSERPVATAPASPSQGSDSLREEIEAIERASRALSQRRCDLARTHLSAYRERFPNGRLQREAEVVAIEIAGRSGHDERARVAARRFVTQFPDSPYALRLAPWLHDGTPAPGSVVRCVDAAD